MNCNLMREEEENLKYKTTVSLSVPCHVENIFLISVNMGFLGDLFIFSFGLVGAFPTCDIALGNGYVVVGLVSAFVHNSCGSVF